MVIEVKRVGIFCEGYYRDRVGRCFRSVRFYSIFWMYLFCKDLLSCIFEMCDVITYT